MKKFFFLMMAAIAMITFASCGDKASSDSKDKDNTEEKADENKDSKAPGAIDLDTTEDDENTTDEELDSLKTEIEAGSEQAVIPQTGAQAATDDVTKGLDDALQAKDSNKLQELLSIFSAKLKDLKNPQTLKVIKDQLPKVQAWLNEHKADVEKVLGDKVSMVSPIADFKIPELPI